MGSLLDRATTEQSLMDAWVHIRHEAEQEAPLSEPMRAFESHSAREIALLAEQLSAASWAPHPVYRVDIPKDSGGFRRLGVPGVQDRVVERAILPVLDSYVDPLLLPWSFAYRRGLGVRDAIYELVQARNVGAVWVARTDIEDCFERIPRWAVLGQVHELVPDGELVDLVRCLLNRPVLGERQSRDDRGRGLHQGSVLAPLLSNLYLDQFDRAMLQRGHRVLRYGDDLAIPCRERSEAEQALQAAAEVLEELELELNEGKTQVVSFDDGVPFLGQDIGPTTGAAADHLVHPMATTVFVATQDCLIRVRDGRLRVEKGEETLHAVALNRVRQVVGFGRVGFTSYALRALGRERIDVVLMDEDGSDAVRLLPIEAPHPGLRRAQYRAAGSPAETLRLARPFVLGKIGNQSTALQRWFSADERVQSAVEAL